MVLRRYFIKYKIVYQWCDMQWLSRYDCTHDGVMKWKHFSRYWPFVRRIHRSPVNSPHKGQWRGALMFSSICAWIKGWVNNGKAGDLRRYRAHYDVTVMTCHFTMMPFLVDNGIYWSSQYKIMHNAIVYTTNRDWNYIHICPSFVYNLQSSASVFFCIGFHIPICWGDLVK